MIGIHTACPNGCTQETAVKHLALRVGPTREQE